MDAEKIMAMRIYQKRKELNLTMQGLGDKLGVQSSAVNKWEKGNVANIKRNTIQAMAELFDVSPAWLMGFTDKEKLKYSDVNTDKIAELTVNYSKYEPVIDKLVEMNPESIEKLSYVADIILDSQNRKES